MFLNSIVSCWHFEIFGLITNLFMSNLMTHPLDICECKAHRNQHKEGECKDFVLYITHEQDLKLNPDLL